MEIQTIIRCPVCEEKNMANLDLRSNMFVRPFVTMIFDDFDSNDEDVEYIVDCHPTVVDCDKCETTIVVRATLNLETTLQAIKKGK